MEIGVGIIGLGFVGEKAHLPSFNSIPGSKVVALADRDIERAKKAAQRFQIKTVYNSHKDLLKDPNVNAVVISVPTFLHYEIAIDAIDCGRHLLCEIPIAPTVKEAREIVDRAKNAGVLFMPGLNLRFTPNYVKTKEMINLGSIASPRVVFFREFLATEILAQQWPANSWAWNNKKSGGGPAFTMSFLSFDLLRWLLDSDIEEILSVSKDVFVNMNKHGDIKGYNCLALLEFANGVIASLQFSGLVRPAMGTSRLEILGNNMNSLVAKGNNSLTLYGSDPEKQEWIFRERGPRVWGHYQEDEHFITSILEKKDTCITGEDALKAQEAATRIVNV